MLKKIGLSPHNDIELAPAIKKKLDSVNFC